MGEECGGGEKAKGGVSTAEKDGGGDVGPVTVVGGGVDEEDEEGDGECELGEAEGLGMRD